MRKLLVVLILAGGILPAEAAQQNPPIAGPPGPVPRLADGKPDMTGVWGPMGFGSDDGLAELEKLYNPAARAQIEKLGEADDPLLRCLPYGVPRAVVSSPWPFQVVQRTGMMVVLTEYYHAFRLIPTDGSPHPADMLPTYFGDSVARWDGDTLVVETTNFNGKMWLDSVGNFVSEKVRVVERLRLVEANTMDYEVVIDDPTVFTQPWTLSYRLRRAGTGGGGGGAPANDPYAAESWEHACHEGNEHHVDGARDLGFKWFPGATPPLR